MLIIQDVIQLYRKEKKKHQESTQTILVRNTVKFCNVGCHNLAKNFNQRKWAVCLTQLSYAEYKLKSRNPQILSETIKLELWDKYLPIKTTMRCHMNGILVSLVVKFGSYWLCLEKYNRQGKMFTFKSVECFWIIMKWRFTEEKICRVRQVFENIVCRLITHTTS